MNDLYKLIYHSRDEEPTQEVFATLTAVSKKMLDLENRYGENRSFRDFFAIVIYKNEIIIHSCYRINLKQNK